MLTGRDIERRLNIGHLERKKLTEAGLLTTAGSLGRTRIYDTEPVERLENLQTFEPPHPSIVVRLTGPRSAEDEEPENPKNRRQWTGWKETWDAKTKTDAARMFWYVAHPEQLIGAQLIAVVAHVVVGTWKIRDFTRDGSQIAFDVSNIDQSKAILRIGSGPLTKIF